MVRQHGMMAAGIAVAFLSGAPALAETSQGGAPGSSYNNLKDIHVGGTEDVSSGGIQEVTTGGIPLLDKLLDQLRGIVAGNK